MKLTTISGQLNQTLADLRIAWETAGDRWNDGVRQDFDDQILDQLEKRVLLTKTEMEKLGELIHQARKACSDERMI